MMQQHPLLPTCCWAWAAALEKAKNWSAWTQKCNQRCPSLSVSSTIWPASSDPWNYLITQRHADTSQTQGELSFHLFNVDSAQDNWKGGGRGETTRGQTKDRLFNVSPHTISFLDSVKMGWSILECLFLSRPDYLRQSHWIRAGSVFLIPPIIFLFSRPLLQRTYFPLFKPDRRSIKSLFFPTANEHNFRRTTFICISDQ